MNSYMCITEEYCKRSNNPPGDLLNFGPSGGEGGLIRDEGLYREGAYLKFFDRQRQNYTMSMEFEMLHSFKTAINSSILQQTYSATCKSKTVIDVLKSKLD